MGTSNVDCGLLYASYTEASHLTVTIQPDGSARLAIAGLPTVGLFPVQVKRLVTALTMGAEG